MEPAGRGVDGQDVVLRPVQDQGRLVRGTESLHVTPEVFEPRRDDGVRRNRGALDRDVPATGHGLLADPRHVPGELAGAHRESDADLSAPAGGMPIAGHQQTPCGRNASAELLTFVARRVDAKRSPAHVERLSTLTVC
jgi:hypothetical protein